MVNNSPSTVPGVVLENLPNALFRVKLNGQEQDLLCHLAGKMKLKRWVRLLPGDQVLVETNPYDVSRGRIVSKLK